MKFKKAVADACDTWLLNDEPAQTGFSDHKIETENFGPLLNMGENFIVTYSGMIFHQLKCILNFPAKILILKRHFALILLKMPLFY